ncbi:MAG TPA: hypothetical protein VK897_01475 [Anaerolineales bacterium]|nr:hypothetical protein [Anaerolineales bacterium]
MKIFRFVLLVLGVVIIFISACNRSPNVYQGTPSQTPKVYQSKIQANLANPSGTFLVRADSSLTISDTGNDGKKNSCKVSSSGTIITTQDVPHGQSSKTFSLPRGTYKLSCDNKPGSATITSE